MTDQQLMEAIREKQGAAIRDACSFSTVAEAFLAALVAGESGGNENAKRFEPRVFAALWEVVQGRTKAYGSIQQGDILAFCSGSKTGSVPLTWSFASALQRLDSLATSWGLTQIMGYEAIPFALQVSDLALPATGLRATLRMLAEFATRDGLDVTKNFSELFDCWNTGRPHAATADPHYIPNGLARMKLYQGLLDQTPRAMSA